MGTILALPCLALRVWSAILYTNLLAAPGLAPSHTLHPRMAVQ